LKLQSIIAQHESIVFFGGAGVSTESGIPDFRSQSGIYSAIQDFGFPPEKILSHHFFWEHTEIFYSYYKKMLIHQNAKPNDAHKALALLEKSGKLSAVITQNIDGLHHMAGSKQVFELHGSIHRNYCTKCHQFYDLDYVYQSASVPLCCKCQGIIKPDVVLYEEGLDEDTIQKSIHSIRNASLLIVGGTSLSVYPAAGLLHYFKGKTLVLINRTSTPYDEQADYIYRDNIGTVFKDAVLNPS